MIKTDFLGLSLTPFHFSLTLSLKDETKKSDFCMEILKQKSPEEMPEIWISNKQGVGACSRLYINPKQETVSNYNKAS